MPNPKLAFYDTAMAEFLKGLGLSESELFPITYNLRVPFDSEWECRSGMLAAKADRMKRQADWHQMTFW